MKKILILASTASMIAQFNISNIRILKELNFEIHVACNFLQGNTCSEEKIRELKKKLVRLGIRYVQIDFDRNPFQVSNILVYKKIRKLLLEKQYYFIHCHSPIGGAIARLAARNTKTKIIYTAHGFHFFKGAPLFNWLLYYPIEKFLSRYTNTLITINKEDYKRAKRFSTKTIEYIPGVGVDNKKNSEVEVHYVNKRKEFHVKQDDIVLLSVGELNKNKNHEIVLQALSKLKNPRIKYLICGEGVLKEYLSDLVKKICLRNSVHLLGFRNDIIEIMKIADIFLFPSKREGLSVALMEAMSVGLPIICSNIRGNIDLVEDGKNGFLIERTSEEYAKKINALVTNDILRRKMSEYGKEKILDFDIEQVEKMMKKIYERIGDQF